MGFMRGAGRRDEEGVKGVAAQEERAQSRASVGGQAQRFAVAFVKRVEGRREAQAGDWDWARVGRGRGSMRGSRRESRIKGGQERSIGYQAGRAGQGRAGGGEREGEGGGREGGREEGAKGGKGSKGSHVTCLGDGGVGVCCSFAL